MSNKINAIYDALDNGNPKSALRLCQTYLQKSSSSLVKALMALSLSRMDQSEAAVAVCEDIMKSTPNPDAHTVETMTYVLRREQKFSLLGRLLLNTVEKSSQPLTKEMLTDCFVANLQASNFAPLSQLAMKLFKLTNDSKYLAWYAFALTRGSFTDKETEKRTLGMALLSLDKVLTSARPPSPEGTNRWSTSGRMNLYIRLFKVQILRNLGKFDEAILEVEKIDSTLISLEEKNQLVDDLRKFAGNNGSSSGDVFLESSPSILRQLYRLIGSDKVSSSKTSSQWSLAPNHEKFVSLFMEYIAQSIDRSDCIVVCSPFLSLLSQEDVPKMRSKVESFLGSKSSRTLVNSYKLLYALGSKLSSENLIELAKPLVDSEDCLDECSSGKQLLLLASIALIEEGKIGPALSILSFGSSKFTHCSHFRLVEFLVYSRILMWPKKAIERFESLGIKNAQWRSLFWLIESLVNSSYLSPDSREYVSYSIHNFFDRHRFELKQNYRLIVDECMFWKFDSTDIEGSPSEVWTEVEKYWSELIEDFEITQDMRSLGDVTSAMEPLEYDYSPLLFISMRGIGEESTEKFWNTVVAREQSKPRCCGFQWSQTQPSLTGSRNDRFEKFSKNIFPGNLLLPKSQESDEFICMRRDILKGLVTVVRGEKELRSISVPPQFAKYNQELVDLINFVHAGTRPSDELVAPIVTRLTELQKCVGETKWVLPHDIGACLNGWIQGVVVLLECVGSRYPKKSEERRIVRGELKKIGEQLMATNKTFESLKTNVPAIDISGEFSGKDFAKKFSADFRAEIDSIKTGIKLVLDRINLGKV